MAKRQAGLQVLSGNRLSDGRVVFLAPDGAWTGTIAGAQLARRPEEAAELEQIGAAAKAANIIVDPYLVEVEETDAGLAPVRLRERLRIEGPTVGHSLPARARNANGAPARAIGS